MIPITINKITKNPPVYLEHLELFWRQKIRAALFSKSDLAFMLKHYGDTQNQKCLSTKASFQYL